MTVGIGVVGGGLVAQVVHLPLLQRLDDRFRLLGLAEPDPVTRERLCARYGIAGHADHRALLDGVDALLVCSPDETHAAVVLDALAAGVHVLVEKPLCLAVEQGREIVAARDRAGVVVQVGYMKRFDPAVEALLEDLAEPPAHIATATYDPGLREAFGLAGPAAPANALFGALVHDVNLVHAVLERTGQGVERVVDGFGADGLAGGTLALRDGARWTAVWLGLPAAGTFREHLALYGADGVRELEFPAPYALHSPTVYRRTRDGAATEHRSWAEAYERQLRHFHACITADEPCRTPPEQALEDLRVLAALEAA